MRGENRCWKNCAERISWSEQDDRQLGNMRGHVAIGLVGTAGQRADAVEADEGAEREEDAAGPDRSSALRQGSR